MVLVYNKTAGIKISENNTKHLFSLLTGLLHDRFPPLDVLASQQKKFGRQKTSPRRQAVQPRSQEGAGVLGQSRISGQHQSRRGCQFSLSRGKTFQEADRRFHRRPPRPEQGGVEGLRRQARVHEPHSRSSPQAVSLELQVSFKFQLKFYFEHLTNAHIYPVEIIVMMYC